MYDSLKEHLIKNNVKFKDTELSGYSTVKIGGRSLIVLPKSTDQVIGTVKYLYDAGIKHRVLGAMSNTLAPTRGYDGVAVILRDFITYEISGERLILSAGTRLLSIVNELIENNLTGFESLVGIPGLVGGLIYENAGAFSGTIADIFESADVYDKRTDIIYKFSKKDMKLGYRHSILMENRDLVLIRAILRLERCFEKSCIVDKIHYFSKRRSEAQPLQYPSLGSVFKRPTQGFAGAYIEASGLKGYTLGGAQISKKHAGFIINTGKATSNDFLDLIGIIKDTVHNLHGVKLEEEIEILE